MIAEADVDSQVEKLGTENMIVLSDEKDKEEGQHKFVYKYQSAESVIQEVTIPEIQRRRFMLCQSAECLL